MNSFKFCEEKDFPFVFKEIVTNEKNYFQISARIIKSKRAIYPNRKEAKIFYLQEENKIVAIAYFSSEGEMIVCSKKSFETQSIAELLDLFFLSFKKIGTLFFTPELNSDSVDFLNNFFKSSALPFEHKKYFIMMKNQKQKGLLRKGENFLKLQTKAADFETLFDHTKHQEELKELHAAYLVDEVYENDSLSKKREAHSISLNMLKGQIVCGGYFRGNLVAKANTNLLGFKIAQLGGIYTNKNYRKRGFAFATICALARKLEKEYDFLSLFVKQKNEPALLLYKKAGFEIYSGLDLFLG